jgi:trimeric autotransporter adhesin
MKTKYYLRLGGSLLFASASIQAADINVTADITANTTWTAGNAYILSKSIFVKNGATLTIEPGTTILGDRAAGPDTIPGNGDDTFGSLVITRTGMINAEGTVEAPIVMTAKADRDAELTPDPSDDLDPETDGGLYGGLIILGDAPINYYTGPSTNANEFSIEGFPAGSSADILYGGTNPTDNSGVVKYMSLRFGGYVYTSGREINGLTMGGVGSGTTIENVEIVGNTDDGMEIFGGTVNTKRIAVAFCQDDSFDLDEGHQGFHQFWFAIQNPTGTLGDRGGEWDGGNGSDPVRTGTPNTTATIYNATFIGDSATAGGGNRGFLLDDYFAGQLHNSVIHQFSGDAITKETDGVGNGVAPQPMPSVFSNNTWGSFGGTGGLLTTLNTAGSPSGTGNSAIGTDPQLVGISRSANGGLDPRPNLASPLRRSALSAAPVGAPVGFFETTAYRGAFGDTNWLNGWSYLSKAGYLTGYPDPAGSGSATDADGDGVSDAVENANGSLGFNSAVNDASSILGTLKTTAQFNTNFTAGQTSVTSNPNAFSLYTLTNIQDLSANDIIVQKSGNTATLNIPIESSVDLVPPFTSVGNATITIPNVPADKQFYRFRVAP